MPRKFGFWHTRLLPVSCPDHQSVTDIVKKVEWFCYVLSGCAVHWDKCLGIGHGKWNRARAVFQNIKWVTTPVKYFGGLLEYYSASDPYWRRQPVESREKTKVEGHQFIHLCLWTVCNIFLVSKLSYVLQVLHCSKADVQKLHRISGVFIWSSSWEPTSHTNLFRQVRDGGLELANLLWRQLVNRSFFFLARCKRPVFAHHSPS